MANFIFIERESEIELKIESIDLFVGKLIYLILALCFIYLTIYIIIFAPISDVFIALIPLICVVPGLQTFFWLHNGFETLIIYKENDSIQFRRKGLYTFLKMSINLNDIIFELIPEGLIGKNRPTNQFDLGLYTGRIAFKKKIPNKWYQWFKWKEVTFGASLSKEEAQEVRNDV